MTKGIKGSADQRVSQERVRELLSFNPDTGELTWKIDRNGKTLAGDRAGTRRSPFGYSQVEIDGVAVTVHRVAWFLHFGEWPAGELDHKNGVRSDNRISNLRLATRRQQLANARRPKESEYPIGVRPWRKRWRACIVRPGFKSSHLGMFDTMEQAAAAYRAALAEIVGDEFLLQGAERPHYRNTRAA
jgi:hypothetical protein